MLNTFLSGRGAVKFLLPIIVGSALSACTSGLGPKTQSVSVSAVDAAGHLVQGALCDLTNGDRYWVLVTPGSTEVPNAHGPLVVRCRKAPHWFGKTTLQASMRSLSGSDFLFGLVGLSLDWMMGTLYTYPDTVTVRLNNTRTETQDGTNSI